jgi:hydrophobic/amphiphilic exporter-1 (mainly G- bacteria), HAE1 family
MTLADLSIKRPYFITCIIILMLAAGIYSMNRLPVDLYPNVTFPIVTATTIYPGAGPSEMEIQVSKVIEDELSSLSGLKSIRSNNKEGVSTVIAEFTLETDVKYAEQQVRDRIGTVRGKLPTEAKEPIIRRVDPGDQPVVVLSLAGNFTESQLFDFADDKVRPIIEQVRQVGTVDVLGGRKREIHVDLDRRKLRSYEVPASLVSQRIATAGQNIPAGKVDRAKSETIFRTLGEFKTIDRVESTIVNFVGNDVPVRVGKLGKVVDSLEDEKSRAFVNGNKSIYLNVYRQSGANTIAVVDGIKERVTKLNVELASDPAKPSIKIVRDQSKAIRANVDDVEESIIIGIVLTIVVVFFFLGNVRSTLITGLALPNSLLGAFILMVGAGFTLNIMTLLALSLAVGLLIDDAIVVRENIFRHMELGLKPVNAALTGTTEVTLAVVATTLTVLAVFGPIGSLQGVAGQFFKEFGYVVCFTMLISLFDALTIAPMLSAYFAGNLHKAPSRNPLARIARLGLKGFEEFQNFLERFYMSSLRFTLKYPLVILAGAILIFAFSLHLFTKVSKTFLAAQDMGEFAISLDMPPGTNIDAMTERALEVDKTLRANKEVVNSVLTVGNTDGEANVADFFVELVPSKQRSLNTSQFKEKIRQQLATYVDANPKVKDIDLFGAGRAFSLNIIGTDLDQLQIYANKLFDRLKTNPALKDADISFRPGKPEFQVVVDDDRAEKLGVTSAIVGRELRTEIEGATPAVFRVAGREYDIRVRLEPDQRDLKSAFNQTYVPNINGTMVRLSDVATPISTQGPSNIFRQDRGRYIQISADVAPNGPGMNGAIKDVLNYLATDLPLPTGVHYRFIGQAESFGELVTNMIIAATMGIFFIYLVLVSLYESFITPFTIMLVLPLAASGAFIALYLTGQSLDVFSMIGCIMLLGIATKNSILLVDYTKHQTDRGVGQVEAIMAAGKTRLRPILMTSFALIAGMLPVAIGLNEASKQRTSMGIAIIGGLVSSTLLTLVVVPAAYSYIERFRIVARRAGKQLAGQEPDPLPQTPEPIY